ncbi:MAG: hypothetical protein WBS18_03485 [Candidatus Acidiferrales bacterium]|jgi:hypothetical protein
MERYASFIGKRVEAHYRAADIHLSAVGTLVSDTGKSIFIEERFSQGGREKTMRLEIPYDFVMSVAHAKPAGAPATPSFASRVIRRF